jgi:hypothetical protein
MVCLTKDLAGLASRLKGDIVKGMTCVIEPSLTASLYLAIWQYAVCSKALTCLSQQAVATMTSIAVDEPGSQRSALSSACDLQRMGLLCHW